MKITLELTPKVAARPRALTAHWSASPDSAISLRIETMDCLLVGIKAAELEQQRVDDRRARGLAAYANPQTNP